MLNYHTPKQYKPLFFMGGHGFVECVNPDGSIAWRAKLGHPKNGVTNGGLDNLLDIHFGSTAKIATWFTGLISDASFSALAAADTMASHAGWTEETADYSQATRPTWTPASSSGQSVSNTTSVDFSITATTTIKGIFLTSDNVKGGTTGILWATALFTSGDQALVSGQTLKVTYTITGAAA